MLRVHVQPGAKKPGFAGVHGDRLKVRIAAPPVDGAANDAIVAMLAKHFLVAKSDVSILRGDSHRDKDIAIAGVTLEGAIELLSA